MSHRISSLRPLSFGILTAAGLAAPSLFASPVTAADLGSDYADIPQQQVVTFGSGWYIRGDIGGTHGASVQASDEPYSSAPLRDTTYSNRAAYTQGVFDGPGQTAPSITAATSDRIIYNATVGAGYQFNNWIRADITADYFQPVQSATYGIGRPCITGTRGIGVSPYQQEAIVSTLCTPTLAATLQSYTALVNGYVDLGTYWIVTPYVGAGVGMSFGHASASATYYQNNAQPYQIDYLDAINTQTYSQNWDRSQTQNYYNLAYALMAGVSFNIYQHTVLDVGYRYLHLGQILGTEVKTQEVRAGLRYMIDN